MRIQHEAPHHRCRGGAGDALGAAAGAQAERAGHDGGHDAEGDALQQPDEDVPELHPLEHAREVLGGGEVDGGVDGHDGGAAEDADEVGVEHQDGQGDRGRHQARDHEEAHRIDVHGAERADLVVHGHRAELGRDRGAGAAGEEEAHHHRPHLLRHGEADDGTEHGLADVAQLVGRLDDQHHADEERQRGGDGGRVGADPHELRDDALAVGRCRSGAARQAATKSWRPSPMQLERRQDGGAGARRHAGAQRVRVSRHAAPRPADRCRRTTAAGAGRARGRPGPRAGSSRAGRAGLVSQRNSPQSGAHIARTPRFAGSRLSMSAGHLSGGTAVVRVAAQQSDDGVEVAGLPRVLVPLPLVAPEDEEAVAAMEVEVLVVLIGGAVERPQPERRADAVAVAAAVEGGEAPDAPGLLAEPPLAEDHRPRAPDGLGAEPLVDGVGVGEDAVAPVVRCSPSSAGVGREHQQASLPAVLGDRGARSRRRTARGRSARAPGPRPRCRRRTATHASRGRPEPPTVETNGKP